MSDARARIREAFATDGAFSVDEEAITVDATSFDGTVSFDVAGDAVTYDFHVTLPTLDMVVTDQPVSEVIVNGWAETLERRLREAEGVTTELDDLTYAFDRTETGVTVRMRLDRSLDAAVPTGAISALANYVDGTYLQSVIPGYSYGPPVDDMLSNARQQAEDQITGPPTPDGPDETVDP